MKLKKVTPPMGCHKHGNMRERFMDEAGIFDEVDVKKKQDSEKLEEKHSSSSI